MEPFFQERPEFQTVVLHSCLDPVCPQQDDMGKGGVTSYHGCRKQEGRLGMAI